jgi:hypothetical protein
MLDQAPDVALQKRRLVSRPGAQTDAARRLIVTDNVARWEVLDAGRALIRWFRRWRFIKATG